MVKRDGRITRVKLALRAIKRSMFEPLAPSQVLAKARTCRTYRFRLEPVLVDNTAN
jgi:hypothetical protein